MSNVWSHTGGSLFKVLNEYLPNSSWELRTALDSPLSTVSFVSLKNSGYCFAAEQLGLDGVASFLSSRVSYLEVVSLSLVSMVHHIFFAVVYAGLALTTIGTVPQLVDDCARHWTHIFYSAMSIAIGTVGIVTPYYGVITNLGAFLYIWNSCKENYSKDLDLKEESLVTAIRSILAPNWAEIGKAIEGWVNDDWDFKQNYKPALELVRNGMDKTETMEGLFDVFYKGKELYVQRTSLEGKKK